MCIVLFGCIRDRLVALRNSKQNGPNKCKSSCHEVVSEFFATNAPDPPPLDLKLTFWCFSYYLGAFGTVWLPYETRCKTGQTSAKVRATKSQRNFSQRTHPSTPLDPNLMFWCVLYYLGAFGTIWLPYETRCKTGRTNAKVCAMKSHRNFSQRTHPIHPIRPYTTILVRFVLFGCIRDRLVALRTRGKTGRTNAKVRATKSRQNFSQRTHPIHPIVP